MPDGVAVPERADGEAPLAAGRDTGLARPLVAEALGSGSLAFLTIASGIFAERYSQGNIAVAVLITVLSAAAGFAVLARVLGSQARGLFNPAFGFSLALSGEVPLARALLGGAAQIAAACPGAMLAHIVAGTGIVQIATEIQTGPAVWTGEFLGTALVILVLLRTRRMTPHFLPLFGALALTAVSLATPSLSLANPAITFARGLTDSFTSIRLMDAALIAACQLAGALAATLLSAWLFAGERPSTHG
jgi:glycerol uptake facilitator-like aquaporin